MQKILDRLKKKLIGVIEGVKTIDGLVNLDFGKLLFGLSDDNAEVQLEPSATASAPKAKRRVLRKRKNKAVKLSSEMSKNILDTLSPLTPGTAEYVTTRNRLCKEYEQSVKTVSGVVTGHKVWEARKAKGATSIGNGKRGTLKKKRRVGSKKK